MSQSCFSLGFLSQNSLWKLFTIRGYKRYLYWCVFGIRKVSFSQTEWSSDWTESRANCPARLEVLSCSTPTSVTLHLLCMLHTCASFGDLQAASQSRDPVERPCLSVHSWIFLHTLEFFFTLSHTLPLHDSYLNTGILNAKLQANWHGIKPTKWLIKFNLTHNTPPPPQHLHVSAWSEKVNL